MHQSLGKARELLRFESKNRIIIELFNFATLIFLFISSDVVDFLEKTDCCMVLTGRYAIEEGKPADTLM